LTLEKQKRQLLMDQEEVWRKKSRAIWLKSGDENTNFFQAFANERKIRNTIWSLIDSQGNEVSSFQDLAQLGKSHFQNLFKAPNEENIVDIIRLATHFPQFTNEESNRVLMEEVTENEIQEVLHSFQKNKSLGPNGWTVEFF
jgi:hypothetical protein